MWSSILLYPMTFACFVACYQSSNQCDTSGKGAWLGTGICTPGLPACFFWGKPTQFQNIGATKNGQIADDWMMYIFHISFFEKEFPTYFLDMFPTLHRFSLQISWPLGGASNLHGEGSTSTILSLAPRTAESTSGRDCYTRGHDLLADCSMSSAGGVVGCQFPRAGKRRGFSMLAEFMPLQ